MAKTIVPLTNQVIEILKKVQQFSGNDKYVFPSFRTMFSTIAYENMNVENGHNFSSEIIEALLSHKESNKVKEAYNRSNYKKPMRNLINWYANYLDGI